MLSITERCHFQRPSVAPNDFRSPYFVNFR